MASGPAASDSAVTIGEALDWICELFEEPKGRITADSARSDIALWDSLGQLVLMSELDQRFGVRLSQEELSTLATVRDILDILARHHRLHSS